MITSSCHGPGCHNRAVVEFWCGEDCAEAWSDQLASPPSDPPPSLRVGDIIRAGDLDSIPVLPVRFVDGPAVGDMVAYWGGAEPPQFQHRIKIVEKVLHSCVYRLANGDDGALIYRFDETLSYSTDGSLPAGMSATYPQVASKDPQVVQDHGRGWLKRAFGRLFGRTP